MKNRLRNSILFLAGTILFSALPSIQAALPSPSTEIKPRSAFAETELGRLIEQAHQENTLAVINSFKGKDVQAVANTFAACVTHDVSPKTCFYLLKNYSDSLKNNHFAFMNSLIDQLMQQAAIDGKIAYIRYFTSNEESKAYISLPILENALAKVPECRADYLRVSIKVLLQQEHAKKLHTQQYNENITNYVTGCPLCILFFDWIFNR